MSHGPNTTMSGVHANRHHDGSCNCPACQHYNPAQNGSSRNPNRDNKVTLHTMLVGVAGTI
eukprot:1161783-Pelagomonas_calceolata.AAC.4